MENREIQERLDSQIDIELKNCTENVYPVLCKMKSTDVGMSKIRKMVREIIIANPMDIGSALAQIDSSY